MRGLNDSQARGRGAAAIARVRAAACAPAGTVGRGACSVLRAARTPRRPAVVVPAVEDDDIASERPIFVDRKHELTRLEMFLEQARAGRGRVVFVTGSPGSGKTMVVNEFVRRSQWKYSNL